jgi:hypothetical protein
MAAQTRPHPPAEWLSTLLLAPRPPFEMPQDSISTKLLAARQRDIVLVLGFVSFVGAVVWLATLPVQLAT